MTTPNPTPAAAGDLDTRDWNNRVETCPCCGQEVPRYKDAVPGGDVVFEYFIDNCGVFTIIWDHSDWTNNTLPDKPFVALGYVTDATAPAPGSGGRVGLATLRSV
jgi:hypothetical protein